MVILTDVLEQSSSSDNHHEKYDVFLSFRGVDTRLSFTNHLHKSLEGANLKTFLDNEDIPSGLYLKPELENAIKSSAASVIVLSKNYATSTWCLEELVLILDQHKNFKQTVIPIFYHVEPTDVRKQQNSFGDAMEEHKLKMEAETNVDKKSLLAEKLKIWKEALTQVSKLTGMDVRGRLETEFIEEIVNEVYHIIRVPIRSTLPLLIGMDNSVNFITSWLKDGSSHTVDILTIYGMGGIGKSSLAKYVYGSHCREFDRSSIILDISRRCVEQTNGLLELQKQLLGDISKTSLIQFHDVSIATSTIENALASNKVFIVLDDIDSLDQLDALLGNKGFHQGSKIIITTRDMSLTERCALFKTKVESRNTKYLLKGLFDNASVKLLCHHAFNCEEIKVGYEEVSEDILKYCAGHPLALKVLGRYLYNRDLSYWEACIQELKKGHEGPFYRVNNILRMSFESLESKNDRELFKYIACFFVGLNRDIAETILKACDINTSTGITHLIDRCLLHIGKGNKLTMHSLIQEMGKYIVDHESENPEERCVLWRSKESFKVLKEKTGTRNIKGLSLSRTMIENKKLPGSLLELETDAFSKMNNLKILQLNDVRLNDSYENFPEELIWLCMCRVPLKSMPSELPMKNLVALGMSYSNMKSFDMSFSNMQQSGKRQKVTESCAKNNRLLGSLKILDLSHCYQLHTLGGFCECPALETLIVKHCTSLVEVCDTIKQCHELVYVDLRHSHKCRKLLHINVFKRNNNKTLTICYISQHQVIYETIMKIIGRIVMPSFEIYFSSSLVILSLEDDNLSCESFPTDWSCLFMLKELHLGSNPIVSMPNCVRTLPRLEMLNMYDCDMLTSIEYPPRTLEVLMYNNSNSTNLLRKMSFHPEMSPLQLNMDLDSLACSSIEIEGVVKIQPMAGVEEAVLHYLGWSNLDFTKERLIGIYDYNEESQTQMYYEFGIFSTVYGGEEMPNWISVVSKGRSISFTIPSSPKQLRGLNFCSVQMNQSSFNQIRKLPEISMFNITKNRLWRYNHCIKEVNVDGECLTYISHWMFRMNDMEPGDLVTFTVEEGFGTKLTKKCGVSFVYDDDTVKEEEEKVLGNYKSWNHIIDGDLSPFQLTTGEYYLRIGRFGRFSYEDYYCYNKGYYRLPP